MSSMLAWMASSFHRRRVLVSMSQAHTLNMLIKRTPSRKVKMYPSSVAAARVSQPIDDVSDQHLPCRDVQRGQLQCEFNDLTVGVPNRFRGATGRVRHPSNVVCQQVQSTRIDRPVFACFKADAGVVSDGCPVRLGPPSSNFVCGCRGKRGAVNHLDVKFQLSCAVSLDAVGWRDGMVAAKRGPGPPRSEGGTTT